MNGIKFSDEVIAQKKLDMIAWLEESVRGTFTQACEHVGISRALGYNWAAEDTQFKVDMGKAREKACESGLDAAETALMAAIKSGNIAGIIFYLKTQGRGRGFIEKVLMSGDTENPLQVNHVHDAERTAFAIIDAIIDAKAGVRALPASMGTDSAPGTVTTIDQPGMGGVVDTGGPGLGQDTDGR